MVVSASNLIIKMLGWFAHLLPPLDLKLKVLHLEFKLGRERNGEEHPSKIEKEVTSR